MPNMPLSDAMKAEGWIEHDGGPCPVLDDEMPSLMFRDGEIALEGNFMAAWHWDWHHSPNHDAPDDIIAYKPEPSHD
jgi:hypothetical protein